MTATKGQSFNLGTSWKKFFSPQKIILFEAKMYMNIHWMVLYTVFIVCVDQKSKMAATKDGV